MEAMQAPTEKHVAIDLSESSVVSVHFDLAILHNYGEPWVTSLMRWLLLVQDGAAPETTAVELVPNLKNGALLKACAAKVSSAQHKTSMEAMQPLAEKPVATYMSESAVVSLHFDAAGPNLHGFVEIP